MASRLEGAGGTPKDQFLASVRSALGRRKSAPDPPYPKLVEDLPELEAQASEISLRLAENQVNPSSPSSPSSPEPLNRAQVGEDGRDGIVTDATTILTPFMGGEAPAASGEEAAEDASPLSSSKTNAGEDGEAGDAVPVVSGEANTEPCSGPEPSEGKERPDVVVV